MAMGFMGWRRVDRKLINAIALWVLWPSTGGAVLAAEVQVVGLFSGKAIVAIDGRRPRTLSNGDVLGTVKLISATSESALFEIDGKRRTLTVGAAAITGNYQTSGRPSVTLNADRGGHYYAEGSINGAPVRFLVDTGATMISLGNAEARRLGINYLKGERGMSNTANGPAPVYRVKLDAVRVGNILLNNVDGLVHESSDMPFALLGMSFLNRVEIRQTSEHLTLTQRF